MVDNRIIYFSDRKNERGEALADLLLISTCCWESAAW